jgi:hypothetical protein
MSIKDFAKNLYMKTFDTNETNLMGSFKALKNGELKYVRALLYVHGALAGTEKVRIKIYSDSLYENLLYVSDWSPLQDTEWLGWLRFDFHRENINKNIEYWIAAEITGYTRNADLMYVAQSFDFPWPVYENGEDYFYNHPLAFQLFMYAAR